MILLLTAALGAPLDRLERDLDRVVDDPWLARSQVAVEVLAAEDGRVLYARDAEDLLIAASVTKTWTAVAAIDALGLDHTVKTTLIVAGTVDGGALHGDLVLVGAGDPTFGADPVAQLDAFAAALKDRGVTSVDGDVVADATLFDFRPLGRGWTWDDALWGFSAPVSAIQLRHNTATLTLVAGEVGTAVTATVTPLPSCVPLDVRAIADDPRVATGPWVDRSIGTTTAIGGTMAANTRKTLTITVPDPDRCAAIALSEALGRAGIAVSGTARVAVDDEAFAGTTVAEVTSPPLRDLLGTMLSESDNLYAESIARWLDPAPRRKSFDGAEPVLRDTARRAGVPDDALVLADGSGLSRYGLVSADALARLFRYASRRPWHDAWAALLPAAGQGGTLRSRMVGGPAAGKARGKTGSMTGVFNLVAYVPMADGSTAIVVTLSNGVVTRRETARLLQDTVAEIVATTDPSKAKR